MAMYEIFHYIFVNLLFRKISNVVIQRLISSFLLLFQASFFNHQLLNFQIIQMIFND